VTKILTIIALNDVTLCLQLKSELEFHQPDARGGFDEHQSQTYEAQQSVNKLIAIIAITLVKPKRQLSFNFGGFVEHQS
jgi:hypothetical protein